jgi:PRTRC genetic system ThiF family protein
VIKIDKYFLDPSHKITVAIAGVGGTGCRVLNNLVNIDEGLVALGHPGLHVTAFDPDTVSESNIGRQSFLPMDVGQNKACAMVSRINRFMEKQWDAAPIAYNGWSTNIVISCVDTIKSRLEISANEWPEQIDAAEMPYYWLDIGNGKDFGQFVLGTIGTHWKKSTRIPTVVDKFPQLKEMEEDNTPSCSLREAIAHQDLFINQTMATFASNFLWKFITHGQLDYHGAFINLGTMNVKKIPI